jgi:hypothetical protein
MAVRQGMPHIAPLEIDCNVFRNFVPGFVLAGSLGHWPGVLYANG